jgi:hypothetical protein
MQDLMGMGLNIVNAEALKEAGFEPRIFCDLVSKSVLEKGLPVVLSIVGAA